MSNGIKTVFVLARCWVCNREQEIQFTAGRRILDVRCADCIRQYMVDRPGAGHIQYDTGHDIRIVGFRLGGKGR